MENILSMNNSYLRETTLGILFCKIENVYSINILCNHVDSDITEWMKLSNISSLIAKNCNITYTTEYQEYAIRNFKGHLWDIGVQYQKSLGCSEVLNHDMFHEQVYGTQTKTGGLVIFGILVAFMCTGMVFVYLLSQACNATILTHEFHAENGVMLSSDLIVIILTLG